MKKRLAIILMLCLLAACAQAMAKDNYTHVGQGVLDISKGAYILDYSMGEIYTDAFFEKDIVRMVNTLWAASKTGKIETVEPPAGSPYAMYYSLDGDDTADLYILQTNSSSKNHMEIGAAETNSCGPVFVLEIGTETFPTGHSTPVDYGYYSPLMIIFPGGSMSASDNTGAYELTENGEAVFVRPAKKGASSVKIPDTVTVAGMTVPVTRIADNAFKGQKKLTKVTIGKNIKEIGKNAFAKCVKLKTVSGGANLEIIGDSAFSGCKALTRFTIGAKVTKIGKKAFYKCAALKKITIKSKLLTKDTVGSSAFKGIYKTATIKVPKAVKKDYTKWLLKKGVKKTMKIK